MNRLIPILAALAMAGAAHAEPQKIGEPIKTPDGTITVKSVDRFDLASKRSLLVINMYADAANGSALPVYLVSPEGEVYSPADKSPPPKPTEGKSAKVGEDITETVVFAVSTGDLARQPNWSLRVGDPNSAIHVLIQ